MYHRRKCSGHQPCELCSRRGRAEDCKYEPGPGATMILQHAGVTQAILKEAVDQKYQQHKQTLAEAALATRAERRLKEDASDDEESQISLRKLGYSTTAGGRDTKAKRRSRKTCRSLAPYQSHKSRNWDVAGEHGRARDRMEEGDKRSRGEEEEGEERSPFASESRVYESGKRSGGRKADIDQSQCRAGKVWSEASESASSEQQNEPYCDDNSRSDRSSKPKKGLDRRPGQGDWASRLRVGSESGFTMRDKEENTVAGARSDSDEDSDVGFEFDEEEEDDDIIRARGNLTKHREVVSHSASTAMHLCSGPHDHVLSRGRGTQRSHLQVSTTSRSLHPCYYSGGGTAPLSWSDEHRNHSCQKQAHSSHTTVAASSSCCQSKAASCPSHQNHVPCEGFSCFDHRHTAAAKSSPPSCAVHLQSKSHGTYPADMRHTPNACYQHQQVSTSHRLGDSLHESASAFYPQMYAREQTCSSLHRYNLPANRPLLPPPYSVQQNGEKSFNPTFAMQIAPPPLPEPRRMICMYADQTAPQSSLSAPPRVSSDRQTNISLSTMSASAFRYAKAESFRQLSPSFRSPVRTPIVPSQRTMDTAPVERSTARHPVSSSIKKYPEVIVLSPQSPPNSRESQGISSQRMRACQDFSGEGQTVEELQTVAHATTSQSQDQEQRTSQFVSTERAAVTQEGSTDASARTDDQAQCDRSATTNPFAAAAAFHAGHRHQQKLASAMHCDPRLHSSFASRFVQQERTSKALFTNYQIQEPPQIQQHPRYPTTKPGHAHRWAYDATSSSSPVARPMQCSSRLQERSKAPPSIQTDGPRSIPGIEVIKQEEEDELESRSTEAQSLEQKEAIKGYLGKRRRRSESLEQENEVIPAVEVQAAEEEIGVKRGTSEAHREASDSCVGNCEEVSIQSAAIEGKSAHSCRSRSEEGAKKA